MSNSSVCHREKQGTESRLKPYHNMEAIAYGVQARFEENTGYERRVTDTTIKVARAMGVPESEIERWASQRLTRMKDDRESLREIKRILEKLDGSTATV